MPRQTFRSVGFTSRSEFNLMGVPSWISIPGFLAFQIINSYYEVISISVDESIAV
jgi:hypothetical protein